MLRGDETEHLADGICSGDFELITGTSLVDSTPSKLSIISYTLSDLKLSVEIYIVYTEPTDIEVSELLKPICLE